MELLIAFGNFSADDSLIPDIVGTIVLSFRELFPEKVAVSPIGRALFPGFGRNFPGSTIPC